MTKNTIQVSGNEATIYTVLNKVQMMYNTLESSIFVGYYFL